MICNGKLIHNTGITAGNYKYFSSKADCDSFFLGKAKGEFDNYSVIRPDPVSKHGFNVACVHLDIPYSDLILCDYVSFTYDNYDRWFHCIVVDREYVNENSTRLHFVIDYVATYYDTIKLGKCFIERTHVNDDWESVGELNKDSANKYFLPEPISAEMYNRPDLVIQNPLQFVNLTMTYETSDFNFISSVDKDGNINDPKLKFQSGGCVTGYLETGNIDTVQELLAKRVTFTNRLIDNYNPLLMYSNGIYLAPKVVTGDESILPFIFPVPEISYSDICNYNALPPIRHAKTLSYMAFKLWTTGDSVYFNPKLTGNNLKLDVRYTGGMGGNCVVRVMDKNGYMQGLQIQTPAWPIVNPSATVEQNDFRLKRFPIDAKIDEFLNDISKTLF